MSSPSDALSFLRERVPEPPEVLLVLGSGLGALAEGVEEATVVPFAEIPGFPGVGVAGHAGRLVAGRLEGRRVLVQAGRFHFYEGHDSSVVVAPVRLAAALGVRFAILTNAAGGIAPHLAPGSLLLLDDHINLQFRGPLMGRVVEGEERFPDMSDPYDPELQRLAREAARELRISLSVGTYAAVLGPSYETPAEIRMLGRLGADAVGMSTVPEVIVARSLGMRVAAFSLITNRAAGLGGALSHQEVLEVGTRAGGKLGRLVRALLRRLPEASWDGAPADPGQAPQTSREASRGGSP